MRDVRTRSEAKLNFNLSLIVRMMHEAFSHNRVASRRVSPRHVGSLNFTRITMNIDETWTLETDLYQATEGLPMRPAEPSRKQNPTVSLASGATRRFLTILHITAFGQG